MVRRNGPWTILDSSVVYENPWFRVRHDTVVTPGGTDGIYGVIEAHAAIGIVPISDDLRVYLVGQHRYPLESYSWEIPEGGGRVGEEVEAGARRELREETGLTASTWSSLGTLHTSNCFTDEVAHLFLAEDLIPGDPDPDDTEDLTVRALPFAEAFEMARCGEIQDSMSIVALYRAHDELQRRGAL